MLQKPCLENTVWLCYNKNMKKKLFLTNLFSLSLAIASTTVLYFAQMNLLYDYFDPNTVYLATISYAYFAQGAGLLLFMLLYRHAPALCRHRFVLAGAMLSFVPIVFATLLVKSGPFLMFLLILTNLLIGYILGNCFTNLAAFIDEKYIGICWGSAYAIGNLLSWLSSQVDATFLTSMKIVPIIFIAIGMTVVPILCSKDLPAEKPVSAAPDKVGAYRYRWILFVILLMSVIYTIGSTDYYMIAETMTTSSTFYTRCMYAADLFIAGIIYDKSRNLSAVFALASIVYPIMASILLKISFQINLIYCLSYFFLGFFAVFRSCIFISAGNENKSLLYLAGLGLLISRFTEGLIALLNTFITRSELFGFIISGVLFVPLLIVFCMMILNKAPARELSEEEKLARFSETYNLTRREEEIVTLLLRGATNGEIAEALTISEGTTRFHVSNVLKKTECKTRNDVVHKFRQ